MLDGTLRTLVPSNSYFFAGPVEIPMNQNVGQRPACPGGEAERGSVMPLALARSRGRRDACLRWAAPVHGPNARPNFGGSPDPSRERACAVRLMVPDGNRTAQA